MDKHYNVCGGVRLTCTRGTSTSRLEVPVSHGICLGHGPEATVNDYKSGVNIMPFGFCDRSDPPEACNPIILNPWLLGNKGYEINGEAALMSNSILSCARGGIIKIQPK